MTMPTLADLRQAQERIRPHTHQTPVLTSRSLNQLTGAELFFKCENFQRVGAFKARGACNAVLSLPADRAARGVVTHSSGNHGAALAWAAGLRGIPATIVVPNNAPAAKKRAIAAYGGQIVECEPTTRARISTCQRLLDEHGYELIHPYDNDAIIAGQGTAALELLDACPDLDAIIAPVGGGGLLAGTALAAKNLRSSTRVWGSEPRGADDAWRSFTTGTLVTDQQPNTVCDGLRTTLCSRTLAIIQKHVDGIGLADDGTIVKAMRLIWEVLKIVVEPSCCPPLAAILEGTLTVSGLRVGIILTGGNVDLERLPWQNLA